MNLTVLIDLDDTLLFSNMDAFLPAYLQALARYLSHRFDGNQLIRHLLNGTQQMVENNRPDRTLEQVFDAHFYPALGVEKGEIRGAIDAFYAEVFPTLKPLTSPRPEAIHLIEEVVKRGYRLAIATNPIFPKTAILQRLAWAGLPASEYPFELISSYETFHFAKPNPAYYAEVLAQMGWPAGKAVMVGNDPQNDASPARQAGLYTYLLQGDSAASDTGPGVLHAQGSFAGILPWLDRIHDAPIEATPTSALMPILRSTPAALRTLTAQLSPEGWLTRPQPHEWSAVEILCHLRDMAGEVDLPRIHKVLDEQNPFIPAMATDHWADERRYADQNCHAALGDFTDTRIQMLDLLTNLSPEAWQRPARHAIFGPTRLSELIGFIATHDQAHVQQLRQTLAATAHPSPVVP